MDFPIFRDHYVRVCAFAHLLAPLPPQVEPAACSQQGHRNRGEDGKKEHSEQEDHAHYHDK